MIILGCMGLIGNYDHSLYFPENTYISIILLGVIGIGFYLYFIKYHFYHFIISVDYIISK